MQTLLKHRWAIMVSLAFTIIFGGLFISTTPAYADGYGQAVKDCTYTFASSKREAIRRTNCGDYQDLTYKDGTGSKQNYTQTSSKAKCSQTIQFTSDPGDADTVEGYLSGQHESNGQCVDMDIDVNSNYGWAVTVFKADAVSVQATDDDISMAAYQSTVYGKLENLITKKCKSDTSGYCDQQLRDAVYACTADAMGKINPDDSGKNNKFKQLFTPCFTGKVGSYNNGSSSDITRDKVNTALGDNIYSEMKQAGQGALIKKSSSTGDMDSCNASGNPFSWVLCPLYDGLGSLSDALLEHAIAPMLRVNPISTNPDDTIYKVWSAFRVWGDILLVIGLIVIVFGQAIGGGILDAYTAKKVLPRILIAAILINLSLYIVAFAVDISNVVGQGIGNIMVAPLEGVSLSPSGLKLGVFGVIGGALGGATTIVGALGFIGVLGGAVGLMEFMPFIFLFVILPIVLAVIAVFVILALRQAIIMALVLVSPIAFALYCLPNTEQYFRKWWNLLFNMLLVYPIIMVIFAAADILAYTAILSAGESSFWAYILAFLLQFIPLLMIPYAFKLAGGVLGRIHEIASGNGKRGVEALKGDARDPWSRRNRYRQRASNKFLEGRESLVDRGKGWQSRGRTGGVLGRGLSGLAGLGNYEDLRSRRNKAASEMVQNHIATGGDSTVRALFARQGADGVWRGTNGTAYSESDVRKAHSLYGRDPSMFQAAYAYELGKSANDSELEETMRRGATIMDEQQLPDKVGVTLGAHWNHQQTRRELKHTRIQDDNSFIRGAHGFTQEVAENVNGYSLSNMRTSTIQALIDDYKEAETVLKYNQNQNSQDDDVVALRAKVAQRPNYLEKRGLETVEKAQNVKRFVSATADSLQARTLATGTYGLAGDDHETPVSGAQSGGSGLVSQRIDELVRTAGSTPPQRNRRQSGPTGDYREGGQMDGRGYL